MSIKPAELKKLVALLDEGAPSAEWLAKAVWELMEELVAKRTQYVVFAVHPSLNIVQAVGPYPTKEKLLKDYAKRIGAYDSASYARVAELKHPDMITQD
jgi:hypothetical protein